MYILKQKFLVSHIKQTKQKKEKIYIYIVLHLFNYCLFILCSQFSFRHILYSFISQYSVCESCEDKLCQIHVTWPSYMLKYIEITDIFTDNAM